MADLFVNQLQFKGTQPPDRGPVQQDLLQRLQSFNDFAQKRIGEPLLRASLERRAQEDVASGTIQEGSRLTFAGQIYNDAAVRAYALGQYADIQGELTRLQSEYETDPDGYRAAAAAYTKSTVANAMPLARPGLQELLTKETASGYASVVGARAKQDKDDQRAQISAGLLAIQRKASTLFVAGDVAGANTMIESIRGLVDASIADGTMTLAEGDAIWNEAIVSGVRDTVFGQVDRAYEAGADVGDVISQAAEIPFLSDGERQDIVQQGLARLNRLQALDADIEAQRAAAQAQLQEQIESELTIKWLQGTLSQEDIVSALRLNALKPAAARILEEKRTGETVTKSDPAKLLQYNRLLLHYSEDDIAEDDDLSHADRWKLIEERRNQDADWQATPNAREARRSLRAAARVIGETANGSSDEELQDLANAEREFFNEMQLIEPALRDAHVLEVADKVGARLFIRQAEARLSQAQRFMAVHAQKDKDTPGWQQTHDRMSLKIQQLESEIEGHRARL